LRDSSDVASLSAEYWEPEDWYLDRGDRCCHLSFKEVAAALHVGTFCTVCKKPSSDDDESLLLCDHCDGEYHMACLSPPLQKVPRGDWFCQRCSNEGMAATGGGGGGGGVVVKIEGAAKTGKKRAASGSVKGVARGFGNNSLKRKPNWKCRFT